VAVDEHPTEAREVGLVRPNRHRADTAKLNTALAPTGKL
jgi:hypothetical protein